MALEERRVVVIVKEDLYEQEARGTFAARYDSMRLTAYGKTAGEASTKLKRLFNQEINYYRGKGLLKQRLERLGVEWYWANQYPADRAPYEDTSESEASDSQVADRFRRVDRRAPAQLEDEAVPLAA